MKTKYVSMQWKQVTIMHKVKAAKKGDCVKKQNAENLKQFGWTECKGQVYNKIEY